jgi:pimeloyl-ACP methyl ester carboxylesterase
MEYIIYPLLFILFLILVYQIKINLYFEQDPPMEGKFLETENIRFFYVERGAENREILLLVHGFQSSHYTFHKNLDFLSQHFHVIALDLPGYGFTDKPLDYTYNFENFAHSVKHFLDAKGINQKICYAGNSMGGAVGMVFADFYPDRIKKLVLVDPANPYDIDSLRIFEEFGKFLFFFIITVLDNLYLRKWIYEKKIFHHYKLSMKELKKLSASRWTKHDRKTSRKTLRDNGEKDVENLKKHAAHIRCRTLVIYGTQDKVICPKRGESLQKIIPKAKLIYFPDCGHMPQYEVPEVFNKTLLDFFTAN